MEHYTQPLDENFIQPGGYGTPYASDDDPNYNMVYHQQMQQQPYPVVQTGMPRQLSETEMQQAISYQRNLSSMMGPPYTGNVYNASPPHGALPLSGSPTPPSPSHLYDPLSPHVSGSDTSADGIYHHSRNSSATGSPSSSRANSLVHRHPLRYNPTPSPTSSSAGRRSRGNSISDDDERMGIGMAESLANTRKEATRRQRIEAEQRRRDELRDGYARLKDALPVSNQKSSKVSLLERATNYIITVETQNRELMKRLQEIESEVQRLRSLNEKISLSVGTKSPSPGRGAMDNQTSSPQPTGPSHGVSGHEPSQDDSSPSPSDGDY